MTTGNPSGEREWMIGDNGQQYGPYTADEAVRYIASGSFGQGAMAWKPGMSQWVPVGSAFPTPATAPPPPLPPFSPTAPQSVGYASPYPPSASSNRVAAGVLGILLGWLGIHKFILGFNTAGLITLLVSIIGGVCTCGMATGVMSIIGLVEGIIYLTKTDAQFYEDYVVQRKQWF